jgi:hypothetical protein
MQMTVTCHLQSEGLQWAAVSSSGLSAVKLALAWLQRPYRSMWPLLLGDLETGGGLMEGEGGGIWLAGIGRNLEHGWQFLTIEWLYYRCLC